MATLTGKVALNPCFWLFIKETISILPPIHPSPHSQPALLLTQPAAAPVSSRREILSE